MCSEDFLSSSYIQTKNDDTNHIIQYFDSNPNGHTLYFCYKC